ncbi:hypothetical protein PsYK624_145290 [Phanerochaete sordida]|uniref:Mug56/Spo71 PH domain-containing protein n=1 Tax=Phanerochaete sordida TaxID=48140 RepID=A0A9P3GMT7_9APHY|nr:hypothetical protein PsYK624_145290 [Phanerochaete sordida]
MATPHSIPPPITIDSRVAITKRDDPHKYRRRFIGPMPERVVSQLDSTVHDSPHGWRGLFSRRQGAKDEDAGVRDAIRDYAKQFFLGQGGREEDWGENEERHIREEMYRRWQQTEWAKARVRRREARATRPWIGTSFDVGVFLGVNVFDATRTIQTPTGTQSAMGSARGRGALSTAGTGHETFVTAPSEVGADINSLDAHSQRMAFSRTFLPVPNGNPHRPDSTNSATPLLENPPPLEDAEHRPSQPARATTSRSMPGLSTAAVSQTTQGYLDVPRRAKGKKAVHYPDVPTPYEEPASPGEVLARTTSQVEDTSAGAAQHAQEALVEPMHEDVVMRDRMYVQIFFTTDTLTAGFDEAKARVTPHVQYYEVSEYIVAWRKGRIELYRNYSFPGREWVVGHKQLAFVIPLTKGTRLSLYSFTDFTFCLTCPHNPVRAGSNIKGRLLLGSKGTNIFVFNVKARTRAADWFWRLWLKLGGELPTSVELRAPRLDTRLRIDIPSSELSTHDKAYAIFTPENTVNLCKQVLHKVEDYDAVIGKAIHEGASLQLAWRVDAKLDWIWQAEDVTGQHRDWAVLYGLSIKQAGKPAHLELRLEEHRTTRIHLKDGTRLDEPAGVEGYLERIRPNSTMKQALYLSTHDGYLFIANAAQALPPPPPGPPPEVDDPNALHAAEALRGARQVLAAHGLCDLRSIVAVRRAFQVMPPRTADVDATAVPQWEDAPGFWEAVEQDDEDHRDAGGAEGLAKALDTLQMRRRRSFELVLTSGQVVRFEAYSAQYALEWIARLRPLISYWRKRHQVDARNEMDITHTATGRPRITPHRPLDSEREERPEAPPDPEDLSPELSCFYDWCLLEGCRAISKTGRLFGRKGLRGQYQHMQLVLVQGHLVEYTIANAEVHHRRRQVVHLLDAYICSGYLAAQHLPEGQYRPDDPPLPRRYQDGLESDDRDEDTLFMVWWARPAVRAPESALPPLNFKRKISVYRTRSKLERDAWVWAIKTEIEKAVRGSQEREEKLRQAGGLVP